MNAVHPSASTYPPFFLAGPTGSDPILIATGFFLLIVVLAGGLLMLRLHHLPEHLASRGRKVQYEVVAVLGLLSMFTGVHAFWIAGLLLALVDFPDVTGPLRRIAGSLERTAERSSHGGNVGSDGASLPKPTNPSHLQDASESQTQLLNPNSDAHKGEVNR